MFFKSLTLATVSALCATTALADGRSYTFLHPADNSNVFYQAVENGMQAACEQVGADCQMVYLQNNGDIPAQLVNFEAAIAQGVDGILSTMINDTAYDDVVQSAIDAGIPVLAVTTDDSEGAAGNARLSFIGQSYETAGYALMKEVSSLLPDGDVHVLLGVSAPGQNWAEARIDGMELFLEEFKAAETGRDVSWHRLDSGMDLAQTGARVQAYVQQNPNTSAYLDAGFWEAGVAASLRDLGMQPGEVILAGFDTVPIALEEMEKGWIQRIVDQQPYLQGYLGIIQLELINDYGFSGWDVDTGRGIVRPEDAAGLLELSKAGIR